MLATLSELSVPSPFGNAIATDGCHRFVGFPGGFSLCLPMFSAHCMSGVFGTTPLHYVMINLSWLDVQCTTPKDRPKRASPTIDNTVREMKSMSEVAHTRPVEGATAWVRARSSETMNLDGVLADTLADEEGGDLRTLVTLELDDLAHLLVVDERAVARELLLEGL